MAVPKKRVGHSAQGHRRSNWKATVPETTKCKNCGELALTHTVCTACGYYKGKVVSIKSEGYVESELTSKPKKAKAATPKAPKAKKEEIVAETVETTEVVEAVEETPEVSETPETEEVTETTVEASETEEPKDE